jgi:hypothetical protein
LKNCKAIYCKSKFYMNKSREEMIVIKEIKFKGQLDSEARMMRLNNARVLPSKRHPSANEQSDICY